MRIREIFESAESISTYLVLLGYDINFYENGSEAAKKQYNTNPTSNFRFAIINILNTANIEIIKIIHDEELWNRFRNDPEVGIVYNRLVNLYNSNCDFIESLQ